MRRAKDHVQWLAFILVILGLQFLYPPRVKVPSKLSIRIDVSD
jgi:hypothetical protein